MGAQFFLVESHFGQLRHRLGTASAGPTRGTEEHRDNAVGARDIADLAITTVDDHVILISFIESARNSGCRTRT